MHYFICLLICILLVFQSYSQEECLTDKIHQELLKSDPDYAEKINLKPTNTSKILASDVVVTIPLVVHVIHTGEAEGIGTNISTDQIKGAVNKLNQNFKSANGLDIGIQFCLAKIDPEGKPTIGITRSDGRVIPNYLAKGIDIQSFGSDGATVYDLKELIYWPVEKYYNIYVVNKIVDAAAFAYYPQNFPFYLDGTVIEAFVMSNLFSTLTHELGHAFNLLHTFDGDGDGSICPNNSNCSSQGDLICDTSPHKRIDCFATNPCVDGADPDWNRTKLNFMSYCVLTNRFTPLQKERMRAAINLGSRTTLWSGDSLCIPFPDIDGTISLLYPANNDIIDICDSVEILPAFTLENRGINIIRNFNIAFTVEEVTQEINYSTNLSFGEKATFSLPEYPLNEKKLFNELKVEIVKINNSDDVYVGNNVSQISFEVLDTCLTTNLSQIIAQNVKIYPIPNSIGFLHIKDIPSNIPLTIEIYDVLGKLILKKENINREHLLNVQNLTSGNYFALFKGEKVLFSKHITIY